jgi:hypothetical protein
LTSEEEISFKHLTHFLRKYDKFLIAPKGLDVSFPDFRIKYFSKKYFGSALAHCRLLLSRMFYETFSEYKFILLYHLDSLVFSDQLTEWCEMDFDYIAPPWVKHPDARYAGLTLEDRVGSGGFSLRKIESFLKVIDSPVYTDDPAEHWRKFYGSKPAHVKVLNFPKRILKHVRIFNSARWEMSKYKMGDDGWYARRAKHYYPEFNIAPLDVALRFGFECVPRYCYEKNNFTLPFGCHAWNVYDREFWEPFLLR